MAGQLALSEVAELIPDIALTARTAGADIVAAAKAFFAVSDAFRIPRVEDAARSITPSDYYDQLARIRERLQALTEGATSPCRGCRWRRG